MKVLMWRPRHAARTPAGIRRLTFPAIGEYAGRARYLPGDISTLLPELRAAVGQIVEVQFAGMAPAGPFAGQCLYREVPTRAILGGTQIPEQDLDFIE